MDESQVSSDECKESSRAVRLGRKPGNLAHFLLDRSSSTPVLSSMLPADLLLHAYRNAVFPMALENGEIGWFSPDPRAIIPLDTFHIPHGLRRTLKRGAFEIRVDAAFEEVMRGCAAREETWISEEIVESYVQLHQMGRAHSMEAWLDGELVGGLYGVALGGAFFGESMFHTVRDASKVALCALVERLRSRGFTLLDTQWITPHLQTFGALEIPRSVYRQLLAASLARDVKFSEATDSQAA